MKALGAGIVGAWLALSVPALAEGAGPRYEIDVAIDTRARRLEGTTRFTLSNPGATPLDSFYLFTYPNQYSRVDPHLTDEIFERVYPYGVSLGEMRVLEVLVAGRRAEFRFPYLREMPPRSLLRVDLSDPLAASGAVEVLVRYTLKIPRKFGSFGEFSGDVCLNGGWHPYLPTLDESGVWGIRSPPPSSTFSLRLRIPAGGNVILNGRHFLVPPRSKRPLEVDVVGSHLTLLVSPEVHIYRHSCSREKITFYRLSARKSDAELLLSVLHEAIAFLSDLGVEVPRARIDLAEAHLRRDLTIPGEDMTLVSDRLLEVLFLGKKFHLGPIVEGAYAQVFARVMRSHEDPADLGWASEAAAWVCAKPFYDEVLQGPNTILGILTPFGVFTSIDRLIQAPRFPFVQAFYGGFYETDALREDISRFNTTSLPGRIIAEKLRDLLGSEAPLEIFRGAIAGKGTARRLAAEKFEGDLDWFFEQWKRPIPGINYSLVETRRSRGENGAYVTEVVVKREGPPIREPVEVEVRTFFGRAWRGRWDGEGTRGTVRIESEVPTWSSRIDPRKRLRETTRVDNQSPPSFKFLVNRFRVRIDLNGRDHEASIGSTIVLNNDYRNRYFLTLFSAEEQDGGMVGYQRSFGESIDPTRYRQSAGLALSVTELDPDFASRSSGRLNDEGQVTPLHVSYRISTFQSSRNPLSGVSFGIGAEYAEKVLGSDFRYWKAAAAGEVVVPLKRDRHILALRGILGAIQREGAPTQLLYDVGGFSGVRGIRSGEFLGLYQWIAKAEYRFVLLDHLRLHILTLGWLRRVQIAAFLEAGNVSDRTNELFRGEDTLIGAGMGVRFHIDLFGINPTVWRFDVGKRIDDYDADTFLFYLGAGQSF